MKTCPFCKEDVKEGASICPHCRKGISKSALIQDVGLALVTIGALILVAFLLLR